MPNKKNKTLFVTVGTTLFEALVAAVTTPSALEWMVENSYTHLIIQYGKGQKPSLAPNEKLTVVCYDFKPSLEHDMMAANLIVSHAGAGTVMEGLRLQKKLVVVINTALMDNHQTELASAMGERRHLYVVDSPELLANVETWKEFEAFEAVSKKPGNKQHFAQLLDHFFGIDKQS